MITGLIASFVFLPILWGLIQALRQVNAWEMDRTISKNLAGKFDREILTAGTLTGRFWGGFKGGFLDAFVVALCVALIAGLGYCVFYD